MMKVQQLFYDGARRLQRHLLVSQRTGDGPDVASAGIALAAAAIVVGAAACNSETPTSPTTTTTVPPTVAEPVTTEEFLGTVAVGGAAFYSFSVEQNGTVHLTLASVGGTNVPGSVWLGLGIGTPAGEDCSTTSSLNTQAGSSAQISGTYAPGIYCARVYDIGNLIAPARFAITIEHP